nr:hypothetical protein [Tanacetum cinerariifolium]
MTFLFDFSRLTHSIKDTPVSSPRSVDKSVAEDVPEKEPRVDDEEADVQRALEESLKSMYDMPWGLLPPVVSRESESGKYQPLPEVPGKGKEKVIEEQVALDLLTLQTHKKKSPANRYIFQRRTSIPTGSSGHDESSSLYAELGLTDSEEESEDDVLGADAGGPYPDNAEASQPMPSHVVDAGSDREHIDLYVADVSTQTPPEQMDEGDKPSEANNDKETVETEAELMVSVMIQQDMSSILPMTTSIIDLTSKPESPKVHQLLKATATKTTTTTILPPPSQQQQSTTDAMMIKRISKLEHIIVNLIQENKRLEQRLDSHEARLYTLEQLDIPHQVSKAVYEVVTDAVDWAMQAPLHNRFRDLPEADMKEILHQRMWETDSYKSHKDHMQLYESLEKSMNCDHSEELVKNLAEARKKKKKSHESPKMPHGSPTHQPPPPPPPAAEYQAWTTTNIRLRLSISLTPKDLQMDDDMALNEQAQLSDDEDIKNAHIPKVNLRQDWWKPLEEERPATPEPALHNVCKPLPLGGPLGQVIIQSDFFFNKDLEYLRFNNKGSRPALLILKMKAAYYPDAGLEQMVPDQIHTSEGDHRAVRTHMRILSVVKIEVFSMYGYEYMKKIVLRQADLNEHTRHLVIQQRVKDFQLGIESYQTQLNLTKPRWDAMGLEYKDDYIVINSSRAIDEALDYRVKEFKINRMNPGLNTRFWTRKDVDRSKEFMFAI